MSSGLCRSPLGAALGTDLEQNVQAIFQRIKHTDRCLIGRIQPSQG